MKITVDVPEDKVIFFLELVKNLNYPILNHEAELKIPVFNKLMRDNRSKVFISKQEDLWDWDEAL